MARPFYVRVIVKFTVLALISRVGASANCIEGNC